MASHQDTNNSSYLIDLARLLHTMWQETGEMLDFGDVLVENKAKNPPASKDFIANLRAVTKCGGETCSICLGEFTAGDLVKELPKCWHYFHADCILPWLANTNTCPMCRQEYPTDDVEYEEKRRIKLKEEDRVERTEDLHNSMFS